AQLDVVAEVPLHGERAAAGLVDAGLLHRAHAHRQAIRADTDQRGERVDRADRRAARGGVAGRGHRRGRADRTNPAGLDVGGETLAVDRGVLVLGVVNRKFGAEAVDRAPEAGEAAAGAVILVPASLAGQRVLGGGVLVLDDAVELERQAAELLEVLVNLAG